MERFDPEQYLALIEKLPRHAQPARADHVLAPAQAARGGAAQHDLSSLEIAIHAAAPCPVQVKEQMIEWWGPIIHEYYGATEGWASPPATRRSGWRIAARSAGPAGKLHVSTTR
jgi:long-chain acyl-CoA synthetase